MSKVRLIKTELDVLLLVKAPNSSKEFEITGNILRCFSPYDKIQLPEGDWNKMGLISELTEEQYRKLMIPEIVAEIDNGNGIEEHYGYVDFMDSDNAFGTAKESFISFIKSKGIYTYNPYGKQSPSQRTNQSYGEYMKDLVEWLKIQQNTGNWLVFRKQ